PRLAFLAMLAEQWKMVAWTVGGGEHSNQESAGVAFGIPEGWGEQARANRRGLLRLAAAIQEHPIVSSSAGFDALVGYDRRRLTREMRLEKVVATLTATMQAEILLGAVGSAVGTQETVETGDKARGGEAEATTDGQRTSAMTALLIHGDAAGVRKEWGAFL